MSRSLVNPNGTPSASVVSDVAKPPSDPTFSSPKYASAMYKSPVFLSNRSPKGLPHMCSFFK